MAAEQPSEKKPQPEKKAPLPKVVTLNKALKLVSSESSAPRFILLLTLFCSSWQKGVRCSASVLRLGAYRTAALLFQFRRLLGLARRDALRREASASMATVAGKDQNLVTAKSTP
jgi:hypothetical protein